MGFCCYFLDVDVPSLSRNDVCKQEKRREEVVALCESACVRYRKVRCKPDEEWCVYA